MNKKTFIFFLCGGLTAGALFSFKQKRNTTMTAISPSVQTKEIVTATNTFLSLLTPEQ